MRRGLYGSSSAMVLVVAMSAVATAFLSAIVYLETSSARVRRETAGMLRNGVPSVDRLTAARGQLRALDGAMDHALLDLVEKQPLNLSRIEEAREGLEHELEVYRQFPFYNEEGNLNRDLQRELGRLDDAQWQLIALFEQQKTRAAQELETSEWRARSDAVDQRLRDLITFNLRHVTRHALRIDQVRARSALIGFVVGGGAVILALVATIVAVRAVRRQSASQEERAHELEMFASRVAHDLMSPMSAVSMALEMATEEVRDPVAARMVGRALTVVKRVRGIVDGLLGFARAGGKPAPDARAPVPKVLGDVIEQWKLDAERAGIDLRLEDPPPAEVACEPDILSVIAGNLVHNALKYMGDSSERTVSLRACRMRMTVCFEVEDTGPGVPPEVAPTVFEPYVRGTTKTSGLGLGLATVKRLVDAHGGRVGLRRRNGAGSVFWFELPLVT